MRAGTLLAQRIASVMEAKLTSEEYAQILQTIEMFEVISQAEPGDCQSYDILKEAYLKIGQTEAALQVSRKLAEAYLHMGLYSSALLECEGILQQQPDSPDIIALMGEIESRTHNRPATTAASTESSAMNGAGRNGANGHALLGSDQAQPATLMALGGNRRVRSGTLDPEESLALDDGNEPFARFLTHQRIITEEIAATALARVRNKNSLRSSAAGEQTLAASFLDEVSAAAGIELDQLLSSLL
ncbi:MAG: hypothetical protein JO117_07385, partial [Verrucomicrobia bacterium]|nr:hypothetical protein [Verrucomicrobiota bacterium]